MVKFFVVSTPIGNLEDITFRAISTLSSVDIILCEDTRVTSKLLERYNIHKPLTSYHSHSKLSKTDFILQNIKDGKNMALVSDAGTPGISDPGVELVRKIRQEFDLEIKKGELGIYTIPGPSALTSAISISGAPASEFTFLGFLPHKKGRQTIFREIEKSDRTMIFYESPHRIEKTLDTLLNLDKGNMVVTICRELTKIYEEVVSGSPKEVREYFMANKDKVRGEFVVIVHKK